MPFHSIQQTIPIVIDTDFGGDPDDAIALVYAFNSPELNIRAIITSDEYKINHRALLLKQWLTKHNHRIPVFSGHNLGNTDLFLLDDLLENDGEVYSIFEDNRIERVLIELAKGEGHYVSIGGLSNLRYLYDSFPEPWKTIQTTIMGGAINYHRADAIEHNVGLDIEAARAIFRNREKKRWVLSNHTFVPELSISNSHRLYTYFANKNDFFHSLVRTNMDRFFDAFYPDSRMHDPLTVSSLFLPTIKFSTKKILFASRGEFRPNTKGTRTQLSSSADYALFWSDMDVKLMNHV